MGLFGDVKILEEHMNIKEWTLKQVQKRPFLLLAES